MKTWLVKTVGLPNDVSVVIVDDHGNLEEPHNEYIIAAFDAKRFSIPVKDITFLDGWLREFKRGEADAECELVSHFLISKLE